MTPADREVLDAVLKQFENWVWSFVVQMRRGYPDQPELDRHRAAFLDAVEELISHSELSK